MSAELSLQERDPSAWVTLELVRQGWPVDDIERVLLETPPSEDRCAEVTAERLEGCNYLLNYYQCDKCIKAPSVPLIMGPAARHASPATVTPQANSTPPKAVGKPASSSHEPRFTAVDPEDDSEPVRPKGATDGSRRQTLAQREATIFQRFTSAIDAGNVDDIRLIAAELWENPGILVDDKHMGVVHHAVDRDRNPQSRRRASEATQRMLLEVLRVVRDPNQPNSSTIGTPLFYAMGRRAWREAVCLAGDPRTDVAVRCGRANETLLHAAVQGGPPALVEALLRLDADVNALDDRGLTPLHNACGHVPQPPEEEESQEPVVRLLLAAKADPTIVLRNARSAFNQKSHSHLPNEVVAADLAEHFGMPDLAALVDPARKAPSSPSSEPTLPPDEGGKAGESASRSGPVGAAPESEGEEDEDEGEGEGGESDADTDDEEGGEEEEEEDSELESEARCEVVDDPAYASARKLQGFRKCKRTKHWSAGPKKKKGRGMRCISPGERISRSAGWRSLMTQAAFLNPARADVSVFEELMNRALKHASEHLKGRRLYRVRKRCQEVLASTADLATRVEMVKASIRKMAFDSWDEALHEALAINTNSGGGSASFRWLVEHAADKCPEEDKETRAAILAVLDDFRPNACGSSKQTAIELLKRKGVLRAIPIVQRVQATAARRAAQDEEGAPEEAPEKSPEEIIAAKIADNAAACQQHVDMIHAGERARLVRALRALPFSGLHSLVIDPGDEDYTAADDPTSGARLLAACVEANDVALLELLLGEDKRLHAKAVGVPAPTLAPRSEGMADDADGGIRTKGDPDPSDGSRDRPSAPCAALPGKLGALGDGDDGLEPASPGDNDDGPENSNGAPGAADDHAIIAPDLRSPALVRSHNALTRLAARLGSIDCFYALIAHGAGIPMPKDILRECQNTPGAVVRARSEIALNVISSKSEEHQPPMDITPELCNDLSLGLESVPVKLNPGPGGPTTIQRFTYILRPVAFPHLDLGSLQNSAPSDRIQLSERGVDKRPREPALDVRLEVFWTGKHGWGVRTLEPLDKGRFVCLYAGEVIDLEEEESRYPRERGPTSAYVHDPMHKNRLIDATRMRNVSAFINFSCDPNLEMFSFPAPHGSAAAPLKMWIGYRAKRFIGAGEELGYRRQAGLGGHGKATGGADNWADEIRIRCTCGAASCAQYI